MLVKLSDPVHDEIFDQWSEQRKKTYLFGRNSCFPGIQYLVLGMVVSTHRTLFLVYNPNGRPKAELYDSCIFQVTDSRLSSKWLYFASVPRANIAHDEFVFRDFTYLGVGRILNEEGFYERYFDESADEVAYVEDIAAILNKS